MSSRNASVAFLGLRSPLPYFAAVHVTGQSRISKNRSATTPNPIDPFQDALEIIAGLFYFVVSKSPEARIKEVEAAGGTLLHVQSELIYEPFASDFGPLHAGQTFRFCTKASAAIQVRTDCTMPI